MYTCFFICKTLSCTIAADHSFHFIIRYNIFSLFLLILLHLTTICQAEIHITKGTQPDPPSQQSPKTFLQVVDADQEIQEDNQFGKFIQATIIISTFSPSFILAIGMEYKDKYITMGNKSLQLRRLVSNMATLYYGCM